MLAPNLNRILTTQRLRPGRGLARAADRILTKMRLEDLPAGTIVVDQATTDSYLVTERGLQPFTFDGWGDLVPGPQRAAVTVLTPPASVAALAHGFTPRLHPTALR